MLLTVLTALVVSSSVLAGPGAWYKVPNVPAGGFESLSAKFMMDRHSKPVTGYYAATQWFFQGHDVQYWGLQPYTKGERNTTGHITYSVFGPGSTLGDPERCNPGADGGAGASCWLDIDLDFGRWYTIESKVVEKTADGSRRWNGTLIDDQGARTYIASFWTDGTYGAMSDSCIQWLEWYKFNGDGLTPETRPCQPPFTMHYQRPIGDGNQAPVSKDAGGKLDDKCAIAAGIPNYTTEFDSDGNLLITAGILNKQYAKRV